MTISLPQFSSALVRPEAKPRTNKTKAKPVADRNFVPDKFIESCVPYRDEDTTEREMLAAAWTKSPDRTIIALARSGMDGPEIAKKVGFPSAKDTGWIDAYNSAKDLFKRDLCYSITSEIPDGFMVPTVDSDGVQKDVDVSKKLRKAVKKAFFDKDSNEIKFSVGRNLPFGIPTESGTVPYTLMSLLNWTAEQVAIHKSSVNSEYAEVFRTRGGGEEVSRPLPPGLRIEEDEDFDDESSDAEMTSETAD